MESSGFNTQSKPQTRIPPKRGRVKLLIFRSCRGPSFQEDGQVVRPRHGGIYRVPPKRGQIKLMILRSLLGLSVHYDGHGGPPSSKSTTPSPYNSDRHSDS